MHKWRWQSFTSRPYVKQLKNCSNILSNALVSKKASSAVEFQWHQLQVQFHTWPQTPVLWPSQMASFLATPLQMPMCMFCCKVLIILLCLNICSNWTAKVVLSWINVQYVTDSHLTRFRILEVAFSCNSQSETFILGNKPISLWESYRQRLLFLCVTLLVTLWKKFSLMWILW